jgi:hypothetical protein
MDPISAVGAAGASVKVAEVGIRLAQSLTQTIRTWKSAPDEILALHNSVAFLSLLLERVRQACVAMGDSVASAPASAPGSGSGSGSGPHSTTPDHASDDKRIPDQSPNFHDGLLEYQLRLATESLEKLIEFSARLSVGNKAVQRARWVRLKSGVVEETKRIREIHGDIDRVLASYVAYVLSLSPPLLATPYLYLTYTCRACVCAWYVYGQ